MTFDPKEARALVDDLQLVAKCLKGENKFPTGQSVILEAADTITALLAENERLREIVQWQTDLLEEHITPNDAGAHRLKLPDGTYHSGPVVDWVHEVFTGWVKINRAALKGAALLAENERLRRRLHRIAQPGRTIAYCQDGHEEAVLIARAALKGADDD